MWPDTGAIWRWVADQGKVGFDPRLAVASPTTSMKGRRGAGVGAPADCAHQRPTRRVAASCPRSACFAADAQLILNQRADNGRHSSGADRNPDGIDSPQTATPSLKRRSRTRKSVQII